MNAGTSSPQVPAEEIEGRRRRALQLAQQQGLDALLVWSRNGDPTTAGDVQYFANHYSPFPSVPPAAPDLRGLEHAGLLIGPDGRATLLVPVYAADDAHVDERRYDLDLYQALETTLADAHLERGRVGLVGAEALPYSFGELLRQRFPHLQLVGADSISTRLRLELSEVEVAMLRHAAAIGMRVVEAAMQAAVPGARDADVVAAGFAEAARTPGCTPGNFLVGSGPDTSIYVAGASPGWDPQREYRPGDLVHFDCWGFYRGYVFDLARSVVAGSATSPAAERAIDGARLVCAQIAEQLRPGVTARQLHAAGVAAVQRADLQTGSHAGFGHAIGCGWFAPYIQPESKSRSQEAAWQLHPRCAFCFESFVASGGTWAAWEEMYLLTDDGVECLSSL